MAERSLEDFLEILRRNGGRVTTARRAILTALVEGESHVTAEELTERVQRTHPDIHLSTVYRTLDALSHLGVVDHVHLGHGSAMYHLAGSQHHHLVCEKCGEVVEAPAELFAPLSRRLARDYGFTLGRHHFALTGRCSTCA